VEQQRLLRVSSRLRPYTGRSRAVLGSNIHGQLGDGTNRTRAAPVTVIASGAIAVAPANTHLRLISGGSVNAGEPTATASLGTPNYTSSNTPQLVSGLSGATALAAGGSHTCALITGGEARCCNNGYGQLGTGNNTHYNTPQAFGLSGACNHAGEFSHLLSCCRRAAKCWGYNGNGGLGTGNNTNYNTPQRFRA
jgi:hypothetical protein